MTCGFVPLLRTGCLRPFPNTLPDEKPDQTRCVVTGVDTRFDETTAFHQQYWPVQTGEWPGKQYIHHGAFPCWWSSGSLSRLWESNETFIDSKSNYFPLIFFFFCLCWQPRSMEGCSFLSLRLYSCVCPARRGFKTLNFKKEGIFCGARTINVLQMFEQEKTELHASQ